MKLRLQQYVFIALLLVSALIAGCSSEAGSHSLDDIPNGFAGPIILGVTENSASIRFDTGVPTVCNAPYGLDTNYGDIATIPMLSGATKDHIVTFSGLEAGSTYHYKIVVTDNQGQVYQSGDFTFTTEAVSADKETNWLALEHGASIAEVSSNFGDAANDDSWGANSAIDNNRGTEWASDGDGNNAFIEINLAQEIAISRLVVHTRTMSNDTAQIYSFEVLTNSGESHGPFELPNAEEGHEFMVEFMASSLRFLVLDSNGGNTGFVEIEAFGQTIK